MIKVYYGPQSGHDLLERTTWHAAQHLPQLYALAERLAITPPGPMPTDAFEGLPPSPKRHRAPLKNILMTSRRPTTRANSRSAQ